MKSKVKIMITLECESSPTENIVNRVYDAMRGHGDKRQGINMKADIGWYLKDKIEENIKNANGNSEFKISGHSYRVTEEE